MTTRAKTLTAARRRNATQAALRRRNLTVFLAFVAFVAIYPALDRALGLQLLGSVNSILIFTMLALGLNIVVGFAGLLDLGYAAFFAIGGYTAAFLTSPISPLAAYGISTNFWVAMAVSWGIAAIFGVILGAPTLRLRGDYLAIVTLAFGEIVPQAFRNLEQWTKGSKGINPIGRPNFFGYELSASSQVEWYYLILAVTAISIFFIIRLHDSRLGRAWMAMREDEIAAASMGIDLVRTKLLAFALGASFSGFAGSMWAAMLQVISPEQFDFSVSIMVLAMIILGGIGNVWGVLVGGAAFGVVNNILVDRATPWVQSLGRALDLPALAETNLINFKLMIFGLALVVMMLLRPEGLFPSAQRRAELHEAEEAEGEGVTVAERALQEGALGEPPGAGREPQTDVRTGS